MEMYKNCLVLRKLDSRSYLLNDEVYKIYKDSKKKKELSFALLESLQKESCWERVLFFPGEDGNMQATKIEYQLHTLSVHFPYVERWVYKKASFITTP